MSNLKATKRENITSGSNNKLRADGLIPAILYGGKSPNQNISVSKKDISTINEARLSSNHKRLEHQRVFKDLVNLLN